MEFENIQKIFSSPFKMGEWKGVLKNLFTNFDEYKTSINRLETNLKYHENAQEINEFGSVLLADNKIIKLYDVLLKGDYDVAKSRVGLRNMIFRDIVPGDMDGILAVFRSENGKAWRLTFISRAIYWDDDFNEQKLQTSPRRYTYVLGEDESVKTAAKQFESLFDKKVTIKQLIEAFNVDKLNKRFFNDYQKHYEKFVLELTGEVWKKKQNKYVLTKIKEPSPLLKSAFYSNKKHARDFCKKLLGRIVFLHFLQKKGWMGCPINDTYWENGEKQFMLELYNGFEDKAHFHSKCLTELFFNTLNKPDRNDIFKVEGLNNKLNGSKVPYLNGGLFETDSNCEPYKIDFPPSFFEDLLDFFGQYNFTIDENSPDDHEVGIDPEMLGHIFENLLEENKEKGAFYTPKEIVQYMTQESLIQYLQTHLGRHEELSIFIRTNDIGDRNAKHNFIRDNAAKIEELLDNVKICDPAIGSGAFPVGMLNEIFEAKMALDMTLDRSEVKKKIIQNSIYGVDLESGAVDIARLRFWLALVVDEDIPHALPNLDYKIMQGNSLLESFEGIDLSEIHKGKAITIDDENIGDNLFSKVMDIQEVYNEEKLEDLIKSYFGLDDPLEKKRQHAKIDQQILGKIYKCLHDEHESLEHELVKLNKKIKSQSSSLSTAEQKIKYETSSKDAKNAKKLFDKIESIDHKQLKLKELYDSDDRPFFLWHLMFQDVFEKGGFDIVIGNPPWGADIDVKELFYIKERNQDIIKRMIDSFMFFVNESLLIVKPKGVICKIIPEVILNQQDNALLREKILRTTTIQTIANLGDNIFDGVTRASCIIQLIKEAKKNYNYSVVDFTKGKAGVKFLYTDIKVTSNIVNTLPNSIFPTQNLGLYKILEEILNNDTKPLEMFIDPDGIQRGVSPDLKKAFIPNQDEIIQFHLEEEFLKDTITGGKDMSKYGFIKPKKRVIYTNKDTKLEEIENIIEYLSQYKSEITCKEVKQGKHPFYALHRARNPKIFEKESKIIGVITGDKIIVALDKNKTYPTDGIYLFSSMDTDFNKVLIGILNSSLLTMIYRLFSNEQGKILAQVKPTVLQHVPIIVTNKKENFILSELVSILVFICSNELSGQGLESKRNVLIDLFEKILDGIVFELYFEKHMKDRSLNILDFVHENLQQEFEQNRFDNTPYELKEPKIIKLFTVFTEPDSPIKNRMQLFAIKSPEILKPIIESVQ